MVLGCCGASAWWAGEQALWEENADRLRAAWLALGRPVFVLACATCGEMPARLAPEIQTVSLYELLAREEILPSFRPFPEAAVFDPCSARHADALRQDMERQLISEDDVRACVWESLRTGERFADGEGHYLACLPKRVMTYWVEYVPADGGYTITRAYCHRMRFESGAAE